MAPLASTTPSLGRVLVIDDQPDTVDLLSAVLSDAGYEVIGALTGGDGLMLMDAEQPDVVLLDLHMPGVPGFEVLRQMRAIRPELPVIIVSAQADVDLARATLSLGATDYVAKPFEPERLIQAVAAARANRAIGGMDRTR